MTTSASAAATRAAATARPATGIVFQTHFMRSFSRSTSKFNKNATAKNDAVVHRGDGIASTIFVGELNVRKATGLTGVVITRQMNVNNFTKTSKFVRHFVWRDVQRDIANKDTDTVSSAWFWRAISAAGSRRSITAS
eukprot:GABV01002190.1.p3 GENE.GABV01002190.1~~GABV01002190.1.p3  ORF type:complete len:137 (+),score=24.41 GABV01002190.1:308-718(+)